MGNKSAVYTLIRNVRIIGGPSDGSDVGSILFKRGEKGASEVLAIGPGVKPDESVMKNCWVYNGRHYYACPGFTDLTLHVCEPGEMSRETLKQAALAANVGGVTSALTLHDLSGKPQNGAGDIVNYIRSTGENYPCRFFPSARLYKNDDASSLPYGSAAAIYVLPPYDEDELFKAMCLCAENDRTLFFGCADRADGMTYSQKTAKSFRLPAVAAYKHDARLATALIMAEKAGCRIHIHAVNTESKTELIKIAKDRGVRVTCDTCPQYFTFNDSDIYFYGSSLKLSPPLASASDCKAIIRSLADGTIDCISSDHTPAVKTAKSAKPLPLSEAGCGMIGLQTLFSASYTALVKPDDSIISLEKLICLLSLNPARILGRESALRVGSDADVTLFTTEGESKFSPENNISSHANTPYVHKYLTGSVIKSFSKGISLS